MVTNLRVMLEEQPAAPSAMADVSVQLMPVTPGLARRWLEQNTRNRKLNPDIVQTYARDMRAHRWQLNGETIKFSRTGLLLDGQHRLEAVRTSVVTIQAFVAFGLPDESFETIDSGKRRTMGDVLSVQDEIHANVVAAALAVVWRYQRGVLFVARTEAGNVPTHAELAALLDQHPTIRQSAGVARRSNKLLGAGLGAGLHYLFAQRDGDLAARFFDQLASGENLGKGDPILALRQRLIDNRATATKLPRFMIARLVVEAWNHCRRGEMVSRLQLSKDTRLEIR